jgi:hypothetical protein
VTALASALRVLAAVVEALPPQLLVALEVLGAFLLDLEPLTQAARAVARVLEGICYRQSYVGRVRRQ